MPAKPSQTRNDTLKSTIDDLIGALRPAAEAGEALDQAKTAVAGASDTSIRAFAKRAAAINIQLTDQDIEDISDEVATGAYSGASVKVRKSEIGTLLRQRKNLSRILAGIDQVAAALKAHDAKARPLNVRQHVIAAARALRNDQDKTVDEVMTALKAKVLKSPPTSTEKARALVERLRNETAYRVKVGDETLIDEDADAALTVLDNLLDGKRPERDGDYGVPLADYEALQDRVRELEQQLASMPHPSHDRASEPAAGTLDGDLVGPLPDTTQPRDEAPAPTPQSPVAPPAGTKRQSTGPSLTGYDIDELLDMTKKKP